ncbi:hypothetical protein F4776DRAFT_638669 [Hypoxylon sp. NC0597]|nr:hypothetical protein F4776DRAFT_638669 [Hypoxylon sp. NC0597]
MTDFWAVTNPIFTDSDLRQIWHDNSTPSKQYDDQIVEEMERIWDSDPLTTNRRDKFLHVNPGLQGGWLYDRAAEEVRAQWIEQRIWKNSWDYNFGQRRPESTATWKHEDPLRFAFLDVPNQTGREARSRPKWKEDVMQERDASRPINQFIYQVKSECERLEDLSKKDDSTPPANIYSRAYDIVRDRWTKRHVWDEEWGVLPGMTWPHEGPEPEFSDMGSGLGSDYSSTPSTPTLSEIEEDEEIKAWTKGTMVVTEEPGKRKRTSTDDQPENPSADPQSKRSTRKVKFADLSIGTDGGSSYIL